MNSILQAVFKVTFVVLCTSNFKSVICHEYDENTFRPSIAYRVKILSDDERADQDTFVNTFVEEVRGSDTLKDMFDLSETPALAYSRHAYNDFVRVLTSLGADDPDTIADFATRPMRKNFDFFTREEIVRVYANKASCYADSQGLLSQDNAEDLAKQYASAFEQSAQENLKEGDPTSKFTAIGNGFIQFLMSIDTLNVEKGWVVAISYESEWLLTAVENQNSTNLFYRCSFEADGDPN
ncbi:uncharacterized protein NPIL_538501 [Nephila pilipes]|uniref:Uncharacterized protein n=1 Tax=Nephila pilipes TaxID=299642 RepID=A0A8X6NIB8_NEPPI|nr:uncharacterized protein NPIL_538501 [Nephila pilipes]